jgi:hypothetical protein
MNESNFHVTGFSYWSNTHDVMGRVSRSWTDSDVAATSSRWILAVTAFSRVSKPEFQHSSPTFGLGILATTMGTFSWRAGTTMGNASVDNTDAVAAATFFFATDGKTYSCLHSIVTFVI